MNTSNKILFVITLLLCVSVAGNSASAESLSPTTPTEGFTFTRDLALGTRGGDVSALQQFLIAGGFLKMPNPSGYFGPLTKSALSAWQASVGINPASGFFGPISREKINVVKKLTSLNTTGLQNTTTTTTSVVRATSTTPGCTSIVGFSTSTGQSCKGASTTNTETTAVTRTTTPTTSSPATSVAIVSTRNGSPVRLTIPKINVDAGFQYNGLTSDGIMEIPNNTVDVGWFTGSVHPGERGTAVVTGHVAQIRGGVLTKPGVFINLKDLRKGDTLTVLNDQGKSITFVVREARNYDPSADATDVFSSRDNGIHMNIITCEGTWHPDQLSYSQRLVVFTDAVQ